VASDPELEALLAEVRLGRLDPLSGVEEILRKVFPIADQDIPDTG